MFLYIFLIFCASFAVGMESGIIGGKVAKPHSRPYLASIQRNGYHTCGGTLIKENYVLTAAHCLNGKDFSGQNRFQVILGAHNISQREKSQQRIQVKQNIPHPLFENNNIRNYSYDIMLLKLKTKAKLNEFVKVLALPREDEKEPANKNCSIAGWGMTTTKDQTASSIPYEVTLKLQSSKVCHEMWQHWFNLEKNICTVSNGKAAFCLGDSGSPLICESKFLGIASYTIDKDCTNTDYPQVYVKIPTSLPWIKTHIKQD